MSSTDKLIIYNYPYDLDIKSIQRLFGLDTTVLVDYLSRDIVIQYSTKQDAGFNYVNHSHKLQTLYYCTDDQLEKFLDREYALRQSPIIHKHPHMISKRSSNREYPFDADLSRRVLFSPMTRPSTR